MDIRRYVSTRALPALAGVLVTSFACADEGPVKTLGTVTVIGVRPTSLPTQIPTTIEGITGDDVKEKINAVDSEDALKYFPSLLVRKRYIGDYDHAVLATRASGTNNSARSLVYADGILLSNLLGNGATFTPRWGLVTPEQIERVDVLYGPFSAAYPGNSVGAVVDYVTRMPTQFEAHARVASFGQNFDLYRTDDDFSGVQAGVAIGDRMGAWSWWLNYQHLDSDGQPIVFANKLVSTGVVGAGGATVTGAVPDRDPRNRPWLLLGATNQTDTTQDHAKVKLAYDFSPTLRASYTLGYWKNDTVRTSESYLRDTAGNPYYGPVNDPLATSAAFNLNGVRYTLLPADFAPARTDLEHFIHGLSIKSNTHGTWDWEVAASLYDYSHDQVRQPTIFVDDADTRGAGRVVDMHGTGWNTAALRGTWRPQGTNGAHIVDLGYQRDSYELRSLASSTSDWISGPAQARVSAFRGETRLQSVYAQDTWSFAPQWRTTLGVRVEDWKAFDGRIASDALSPLKSFPERTATYVSPKAALAYQATDVWAIKASVGRAVRTPTVSELYQGSVVADAIVNNDPNLDPEKSWTAELTAEALFGMSSLRTTVFHEDTRDALYSQINVAANATVQTVQNVDHLRTTGVEIAYSAPDVLVSGLDLSSSLTYAHSRIVANDAFPASVGKWQPRVPEWRANLLATYRFAEKWSATLGARYSGKQFNQLDNTDVHGAAYTGLTDFFVIDARVRYRITDQIAASLSMDNVNNENYWAFHPYPQRTLAAEVNIDF
jgi:iron complex outermembrane receptor protein